MPRTTSAFLDVLRLVAALTVYIAHTAHFWKPAMLGPMQAWAHQAIIVFFVLSGYVIAYTTRAGGRDARGYTVARLARLYSVVIPALVLTAVVWLVLSEIDQRVYEHYQRSYPALRFLASGFFFNEVWMLELSPPANTPFWSLGYEFWYYAFFGVALFVRRMAAKVAVLVACALVTGPNILMLLPVWLIGVAAYAWRDCWVISRSVAVGGLIVASAATVAALLWLPDWWPVGVGTPPWHFAGAAISDFICGLGWGAVIWFFDRCFRQGDVPRGVLRPVRWLAGHTFSLYLYHAPLVILATALFPPVLLGAGSVAAILSAILAGIIVLGAFTEGQRNRWYRLFAWLWDFVAVRVSKRWPPSRETA